MKMFCIKYTFEREITVIALYASNIIEAFEIIRKENKKIQLLESWEVLWKLKMFYGSLH